MPPAPSQVCVVVSTYERCELLGELVAGLRSQTLERFEAVLVDDGSADGSYEELERLTAGDPRFRLLRSETNGGPARGRNLAWRTTHAPWVAFTDDDCVPDPGWLEGLLHTAAEGHELVQGRTVPGEPPGGRWGWFDRTQRIDSWSGRFQTCNLLVQRSVLEQHHGFDESLEVMGEDTDLGLRVVAGGARTAFAPDAVVVHRVWPGTWRDYLRQRRRYATTVKMVRVNPAARGLLRFGFVLRGVHLLVWALPPVAAWSVVVGMPWVGPSVAGGWVVLNTFRTRGRPFPLVQRVAFSALHLLAYAYETACFAAASVRHRALVL